MNLPSCRGGCRKLSAKALKNEVVGEIGGVQTGTGDPFRVMEMS